ncbi:hypothetical protein ACIQUB_06310 [Rhizobium sp. NPDC090275]|uniref:hypothetical protein n=1 Tax=Rhizobium sp. NPDC090275 TaxID=3364498 RepID=UPI00383A2AD7
MFGKLTDIIKIPAAILFGLAIGLAVMLFAYEGIRMPIVGQLVNGKVQDVVTAALAQQKAVCDGRIEKLSSSTELAALKATLDRERALRRMADEAAAQADERAFAAERQKTADQATIARLLAEAMADTGLSRPNERDRAWQAKH